MNFVFFTDTLNIFIYKKRELNTRNTAMESQNLKDTDIDRGTIGYETILCS